jgi:hypothetical protein
LFRILCRIRLTRLAANDLIRILDAFALVRIGLAKSADLRRGLTDFLFVDASNGDVAALRLDGDLDSLRNGEAHGMRVAELEDDFLPFDFGTVTDADDVELALESVGDPSDVVRHERAHQAVKPAHPSFIVRARELHHVVLDRHTDTRHDRSGESAFRPFHRHDVAVVFHFDAFRHRDFFSSNS